PVNEVTDLNEQANLAGAGINIAQRVMDCGDAGHILVSKRVADDLEHYSQWRSLLHELGECEVKHGLRISLLNLYGDEAGNEQLHVNAVLEGSVRKAGDKLRITAQLINVADGYHLWSEDYDGDVRDIFTFQSNVAQRVVAALQIKLGVEAARALAKKPTENPE